jgi:hypothetical protein
MPVPAFVISIPIGKLSRSESAHRTGGDPKTELQVGDTALNSET